jgi:hypothetical protein
MNALVTLSNAIDTTIETVEVINRHSKTRILIGTHINTNINMHSTHINNMRSTWKKSSGGTRPLCSTLEPCSMLCTAT